MNKKIKTVRHIQ